MFDETLGAVMEDAELVGIDGSCPFKADEDELGGIVDDEEACPSPAFLTEPDQLWLFGIFAGCLTGFDLARPSLFDLGMPQLMQLSSRAWSSADGSSSFELTLSELNELFLEKVTGVSSTRYECRLSKSTLVLLLHPLAPIRLEP